MFQHGITTDRSAALAFGSVLAAQGVAVIAIDQPLHGVGPASTSDKQELAETSTCCSGGRLWQHLKEQDLPKNSLNLLRSQPWINFRR